ncbi:hypothetical protein RAAC3_TM7C00001G0698 [Candidatus Saccharibacteria bacterium RAAC3_TM7_1]|nr:hypothetical protein RAAC3_TM7C00001G0698 [Candidatus Saccharibacteria bacterium RAAC3_TM7_1]HCZ28590.1 Crp/Fnr family transcriptional regulator [Candidatus Saccharibacteria bacterium]
MNTLEVTTREFFHRYPLRRYGKGQIIMRPDENVTEVLYLEDGQVVQYDISPAGNEVILNIFKPRAFFPMSNAVNNVSNYYFFEAATPVAARAVPVQHAVDFLREHPEVTFDLLSRVYKGTDGVIRRMAHLMGGTAKSRLVFELLNVAYRFGQKDEQGAIHLSVSENDLAKRSGLTRETVNRTMKELKNLGCVKVRQHRIEIPDLAKLEDVIGTTL